MLQVRAEAVEHLYCTRVRIDDDEMPLIGWVIAWIASRRDVYMPLQIVQRRRFFLRLRHVGNTHRPAAALYLLASGRVVFVQHTLKPIRKDVLTLCIDHRRGGGVVWPTVLFTPQQLAVGRVNR